MIAGLEEITAGTLHIGDRKVNDVAPKDRDIAMVFQSYALYPHMSVFENMAFGLRLQRLPNDEIQKRVQDAADVLGLNDLLSRKPRELSGGQRQRVAMGRAIVRRPAVFLFDEPLSNLDARLRVQMRTEIARLHRQLDSTSIYVTHDQVEAMTLADRIVVMDQGRVMQVGSPMELYHHPANLFVATFIGSPSMNVIPLTYQSDNKSLSFGELALDPGKKWMNAIKQADTTAYKLGIRPQFISITDAKDADIPDATLEVVEPLGGETFYYFKHQGETIVVREDHTTQRTIGETYGLSLQRDAIHLFDADTGQAISYDEHNAN
jgi:multiple sugar transport system ATP-binding protein